jgi:predicted dinucleotide-binding enzyme
VAGSKWMTDDLYKRAPRTNKNFHIVEGANHIQLMHIGILGSGLIGRKLGTIFARAGHDVVFSYSRNRRKLKDLAKAFSTVPSEVLFSVFEARGKKSRPDLVYYGDDSGAKKTTAGLIRDAGFNAVAMGWWSAAVFFSSSSQILVLPASCCLCDI